VPERVVLVNNQLGMHARAAARFVKTAARYDAVVTVTRGETTIDGKSILGLLFLAAAKGSRLRIQTSGPEAAPALEALTRLVDDGIGDPPEPGTDGTGRGTCR
jgi:phosphocarrier protein